MAAKDKNAPAAKAPVVEQPAVDEHNPASDPNLTAQERLDALTKQHEAMHGKQKPGGDYPL
jgi:hypothetical protein